MCYPRVKRRAGQTGAALMVAMLVFALVAALMVGLQRDFMLILQRGSHQLFSEQAWRRQRNECWRSEGLLFSRLAFHPD